MCKLPVDLNPVRSNPRLGIFSFHKTARNITRDCGEIYTRRIDFKSPYFIRNCDALLPFETF